ncbi:MAG TPA: SCP2 sterol-binding domain-containing protein [Acidimicrobiales bacterium]
MADKPHFGTLNYFEALANEMNNDPEWLAMATPMTYTMVYDYGEPVNKIFVMDFKEGRIDSFRELQSVDEVEADFTFTGPGSVWAAVIKKDLSPTVAMATGKLKVDGPQTVLLRHMKKFAYLNDKMANMDAILPD